MISSVARIPTLALGAYASAVLFSACGSAGSATGSVDRPISTERAAAYAAEINLRAADMPGFSVTDAGRRFATTPQQQSPCIPKNVPGGYRTTSPTFAKGGRLNVVSSVLVYTSRAEGTFTPSPAKLKNLVRCERRRISSEGKVKPAVSALPLPPGLRGAPFFALRLCEEGCQPGSGGLVTDAFWAITGRFEVTLSFTSTEGPPRPAMEQRVLSLLYNRVKAHKLT